MNDLRILAIVLFLAPMVPALADDYAQVLSVVEIKEVVKTPRERCEELKSAPGEPAKDKHKVLGTVGGAVLGGVLGNQIGGGRGKDIATAAGAVGGALVGRKVQGNQQEKKAAPKVESRCQTVTEIEERIVGYDVRYRYQGKEQTVRMKRKPGDRLPVKGGKVVIE